MDDKTISISISGDEEEFIAAQIAAGNFADEKELLHAGLAALERDAKAREFDRLIAEGDADVAAGRVYEYETTDDLLRDITAKEFAD